MQGYKLLKRMEEVEWQPPMLTFCIERHAGTVLGSTRAELQSWAVDVNKGSAILGSGGRRQLYPPQARLNIKPLAEEIAGLILSHKQDGRLTWAKDGSVRVLIGKILPSSSAVKQTLSGRRKSLSKEITAMLAAHGWIKISIWKFTLGPARQPAEYTN